MEQRELRWRQKGLSSCLTNGLYLSEWGGQDWGPSPKSKGNHLRALFRLSPSEPVSPDPPSEECSSREVAGPGGTGLALQGAWAGEGVTGGWHSFFQERGE